jgi:hypothetical protein
LIAPCSAWPLWTSRPGWHLCAAAAVDDCLAGGGEQYLDRAGLCEWGQVAPELCLIACLGNEVESVLVVGDCLGLQSDPVLAGGGWREVAEQGRAHGWITGGAVLRRVLVDRDEECHRVGLSD